MILLRLLGYVWSAPYMLVLGVPLALIYRSHSIRWSDGCIELIAGTKFVEERGKMREVTRIWGKPGAQTHGWLIIYASESRRRDADLRVHERVHVIQGFIGSAFYALSYTLHFLWLAAFTPDEPSDEPRWRRAYFNIWAERMAYRIQREFKAGKRPNAWGG